MSDNKKLSPKKVAMIAGIASGYMMIATGCGKVENNYQPYTAEQEKVVEGYSVITDDDLNTLPDSITSLQLFNCHFITNLDMIPERCPNITVLDIDSVSSLTDLSFIYELKHLEKVTLNNCVGINEELIQYFKDNGIEYEINELDMEAADIAKDFIDKNITDDMTDEEKVKKVIDFVSHTLKYRLSKTYESNDYPLASGLVTKKGVCASYAYVTNQLLRMAGVESYEIVSNIHAWNLVNIDGEFYYIDVTNLGGGLVPKKISSDLINKINVGMGGYKVDPRVTLMTAMKKYDSSKIVIPESLEKEVRENLENRNLYQKYKNSAVLRISELLVLLGVVAIARRKLPDMIDDWSYSRRIKRSRKKYRRGRSNNRNNNYSYSVKRDNTNSRYRR